MKRIKYQCMFAALFFVLTTSIHALTRINLDIEVVDKGTTTKHNEIITFDDQKARFDFVAAGQKKTATTPYILTVDGGMNWIIGDPHKDTPSCAQVDLTKFFQKVGGTLTSLEGLVNPKISEPKITKLLEEDGPKMMGFPTKHVRVQITASAKASFLFKKYEYAIRITDNIWYATNLGVHPIRKQWFKAISQSGYPLLDKIFNNWINEIKGAVLRQDTIVDVINVKKQSTSSQSKKVVITSIKDLKPDEIDAATFKVPKCKNITNKQITNTAKDMFKEGRLTP